MTKYRQKHHKGIALLCLFSLVLGSFSGTSGAAAKKPSLSKKKLTLTKGMTKKLKIKRAAGSRISWKVKKKKIVKVKKTGKTTLSVTGKKTGSTKLTVNVRIKNKKTKLTCKIKVIPSRKTTPSVTWLPTTAPVSPSVTGTPADLSSSAPDQSADIPVTSKPVTTAVVASSRPAATQIPASKPATTPNSSTPEPVSTPDNTSTPEIPSTQSPDNTPVTPPSVAPTAAPVPSPGTSASAAPSTAPATPPTALPSAVPSVAPTTAPFINETMTLTEDYFLGSGVLTDNPIYHADGSVTFTAGNGSSGGGLAFYLNSTKTSLDLSGYSQVTFRLSATEEVPVTLLCYTGTGYWSGRSDMAYPSVDTETKDITYDIPKGKNIYGFGVKYNTNSGTASLPETATITIHSITLVKDNRNITDATTNYEPLYSLAIDYGFKLGTVMSTDRTYDTMYSNLMKYHFNSITAANEMKAYCMLDQSASKSAYIDESSMPKLNYTNADVIAQYAKDNDMGLRGHVLVWDADMNDWFFRVGYDSNKEYASKDVIKARMKNYIDQVLTHFETKFPGVVYCWDVVNEAVGDNSGDYKSGDDRHVRTKRGTATNLFYDHVGSDYVELAFQYAHEVVEELKAEKPSVNIDLYYNDYNTFYADKRDAICNLITSINSFVSDEKGGYVKLCDGVGMQSYIGGYGSQGGCMNESNIQQVKTAIEKFASLGVDVQVTELAVRNYQGDDETQKKHGEFYEKLFRDAYIAVNRENASKPLKAVSIWGIIDIPTMDEADYGYRMNGPYCGLFDENLAVKDAFKNLYRLFSKES